MNNDVIVPCNGLVKNKVTRLIRVNWVGWMANDVGGKMFVPATLLYISHHSLACITIHLAYYIIGSGKQETIIRLSVP